MKHILLLGGAGTRGRELAQCILDKGWRVTVLDRHRDSLDQLPDAGSERRMVVWHIDARDLDIQQFPKTLQAAAVDAIVDLIPRSGPAGGISRAICEAMATTERCVRCAVLADIPVYIYAPKHRPGEGLKYFDELMENLILTLRAETRMDVVWEVLPNDPIAIFADLVEELTGGCP